jgi:predicted enzyme related to lactoylglutathione lyase
MDKVVHFEIPMDDPARAKEFYGSIFGWDIQAVEHMDYTMAMTTPVDEKTMMPTEPGAINGGMMARSADTPAPVITIGVSSIDESLKRIEEAGGSTVTPRTPIPDMGAFAYFKDSEGNVLGLWETA